MTVSLRTIIDSLGGSQAVARQIGKRPTTVYTHVQSGVLPAAWYDAMCSLCETMGMPEPDRGIFSFLKIPGHGDTDKPVQEES
ncbi:hypothetical protein [Paracoccus sp. (in: a-proteobacteria)]|uniref:hypothetical protein n=1 Tax=Paracoccus sp. TaxID=267 RepID=UPI003A88F83F